MEYNGAIQHCLIYFLSQSCPSHVFIIIIFDVVEFLLDDIDKSLPSGLCPKYFVFIPYMPLIVPNPPKFDMENGFKERRGDIFTIRNFFSREVTL